MSKPEMYEHKEFTCPECGSHTYGTDSSTNPSVGVCNGYAKPDREPPMGRHATIVPVRCKFMWSRTTEEDAKYFKGTGHFSPLVQKGMIVPQ